jgi:hypothetical protein
MVAVMERCRVSPAVLLSFYEKAFSPFGEPATVESYLELLSRVRGNRAALVIPLPSTVDACEWPVKWQGVCGAACGTCVPLKAH